MPYNLVEECVNASAFHSFISSQAHQLRSLTFSLCAVQACSGDEKDEAMDEPSKNTTDIAVTGSVEEYGCIFAKINGYANLNLLPAGSGNPQIGIEISMAEEEDNEPVCEIATSMIGNSFSVEFRSLNPGMKYKYRSFVEYAGIKHYGEYKTFTTKKLIQSGAVNLGLSVKWAACNVGASSPEEYGGYYAWGETEEKSDYSWDTYKWCNGSWDSMTKYCTDSYCRTVDNKTVLDPEDDVAHVKLGGSWRMPTLDEIEELCNECTWTSTTYNGVKGQLVTGPNGNSIFLPAAGYCRNTDFEYRGLEGGYSSAGHAALEKVCSYRP